MMLEVVNNKAATVGMLPDTCVRCAVPLIVDSSLYFSAFVGASAKVTQEVLQKNKAPLVRLLLLLISPLRNLVLHYGCELSKAG